MYWTRTNSLMDIVVIGILSLSWAFGGWMLAAQSGRFRKRENLVVGIAFGLLFFILLSNLLSHFLDAYIAFMMAGALILVLGLWVAWRSDHRFFHRLGFDVWPQALALFTITVVFTLVLRGLGVGDEYLHLPLVSQLAAGDVPPHYSLHPDVVLPYHYGLDLFAANLVRIGGLFPWSSWDLSRSFVFALTVLCLWFWLQRTMGSSKAALLGTILVVFGMGTRWLLALLPLPWIDSLSSNVQLIGSSLATGNTLAEALFRPWKIAGMPPIPIPFAFANGVFSPLVFNWAGASNLPILAILLMLLCAGRHPFRVIPWIIFGTAFLTLALSAEHVFILIGFGFGLVSAVMLFLQKPSPHQIVRNISGQLLLVILVAVFVSFFQGGVITEIVSSYLGNHLMATSQNGQPGITNATIGAFSLRWPPVFYDAHFGDLSPFNWQQLVVLIAEIGPIVALFPVVVHRFRNDLRTQRIYEAGLAIAALLGIIIPLFLDFRVSRDIVRFTGFGLTTCLILSPQPLWAFMRRASGWLRGLYGLIYILIILGGLSLLAFQSTALVRPQLPDFISNLDAQMSQMYWNRLPLGALVFDPDGVRSQTIFGRLSTANIYQGWLKPEFQPYVQYPDPYQIHEIGFSYIYIDGHYWDRLSPEDQKKIYSSCTQVLKRLERYNSATGDLFDFRVLIDITNCK